MPIEEKTRQPLEPLLNGDSVEGLYAALRAAFDQERARASSPEQLKALRDRWLGRKNGLLSHTNANWLKSAPRDLKPQVGRLQNETRRHVEQALSEARQAVQTAARARDAVDVTLPGPPRWLGAPHPVRIVQEEIEGIFRGLGYSVAEGPEIETFYYNFEALNFPEDHPAVEEMDTIFIEDKTLLRTHTSPCQIRIMESRQPPLRYLVPGKVYRHDTPDSTHSPMFHQIEGFAVDEDITLSDLKGTLEHFAHQFFGPAFETRFRPSFFPFTEPSAELDVRPEGGEYLEVLGCGMIDPEVFRHVGYDPERYTGFAFGLGIDRMAMLKYGIDDIQLLYQGDVRFLRQFR